MVLPSATAPPTGWTGVISRVQYKPLPASDQPGFKGRFAAEKQENSLPAWHHAGGERRDEKGGGNPRNTCERFL